MEHEVLKDDLKEILNQNNEELTMIIESLKIDVERLKTHRCRRKRCL